MVFALASLTWSGCHRQRGRTVVAKWKGGEITQVDVDREAARMPAPLLQQFESPYGRRELASALVDKRLLVEEARRRGLSDRPEIRKQVEELEERLAVQALVAEEAKRLGPPSEAEQRTWFQAHSGELAQPARVRVSRILVKVDAAAPEAERARARSRADALARRLRGGEPFPKVAGQGDGPERSRGGDIGFVVEQGAGDPALSKAALALTRAGELSAPFACREGIAILRLDERTERRVPSFEEAAGQIANRLAPERQRRIFEALLEQLRKSAKVELMAPADPKAKP